jgi:hypothetical protein
MQKQVLLLPTSADRNLRFWSFFDVLNAKEFTIWRKKAPNLMSAGREPNATCSNQNFS